MFWLLALSTALLGVGAIVYVLTRDAFRASRARREADATASPVKTNHDATAINTMMEEKLSAIPPPNPAALVSGQGGKETDAFADTLAQVKGNPILPNAPKAYLFLEERDDSLDHLLIRRIGKQGGASQAPPREFSIGVTEKNGDPLEREKETLRPGAGHKGKGKGT